MNICRRHKATCAYATLFVLGAPIAGAGFAVGLREWMIWLLLVPVILLASWVDREGFWGVSRFEPRSFDVCLTVADLGRDPAAGERVFEKLVSIAPQAHPVVSQSLVDETLSISLSCDAPDAASAVEVANALLRRTSSSADARVLDVRAEPPVAV